MDHDDSKATIKFIIFLMLISIPFAVIMGRDIGRSSLAHQIANGTHKVEWSTNDFGTTEVRVVEVE